MDAWAALIEVLILLTAALVLGTVAEQFRQHAIVGYLVAGALVGPHGLSMVEEHASLHIIAELGVAMLLFTIGLEFSFGRLMRMGRAVWIGGAAQVVLTMAVAAVVGGLFGLSAAAAVAVGAMVTMSSTACVLRMLTDRAEIDSEHGRATVGVLLIQDLAVVPLMLLVGALGGQGGVGEAVWEVSKTLVLGAGMVGVMLVMLNYVTPYLLNLRTWTKNRELPILLAVVTAMGASVGAARVGISPAMGAFIAGLLLAGSPFAVQVRSDVSSVKTLLVTLFFASIGMLGDFQWAAGHAVLVIGVVVLVVGGKTAVTWGVLRMTGLSRGMALAGGLTLAQVGEFSFVLAGAAMAGGVIAEEEYRLLIAVTILTLMLTPYLVRLGPRAAGWVASRSPEKPDLLKQVAPMEARDRIVIVGFGPAGQRVAEALIGEYRARITVVDTNPRNIDHARSYGLAVQIGDATRQDVLEHLGLGNVKVVVIALPDATACRQIIHLCRQINANVTVVARARYHVFRWELMLAGAQVVVDEEDQVGVTLAGEAKQMLGAADAKAND
ncbi:MAG: cation:proton antiporter [Phycisphaerales bacterium]